MMIATVPHRIIVASGTNASFQLSENMQYSTMDT